MRKPIILGLLLITLAATQLPAQTLSYAEVADRIETVQGVSASKLEKELPQEPFAEWLRLQMPRDARFGWAVITANDRSRTEDVETMPLIEVDVSRDGHPLVAIYIACKSTPTVQSIKVIKGRDVLEVSHLQYLRAALAE